MQFILVSYSNFVLVYGDFLHRCALIFNVISSHCSLEILHVICVHVVSSLVVTALNFEAQARIITTLFLGLLYLVNPNCSRVIYSAIKKTFINCSTAIITFSYLSYCKSMKLCTIEVCSFFFTQCYIVSHFHFSKWSNVSVIKCYYCTGLFQKVGLHFCSMGLKCQYHYMAN